MAERGRNTRFTRETAVAASKRSAEIRHANIPVNKCLRRIASEALYGHPPLPESQLKAVADFFEIKVKDVTFAHLAIFKQSVEMAKGDASAFNLVAAYAGEKPTENVNVSVADPGVMDEIRRRMDGEVK